MTAIFDFSKTIQSFINEQKYEDAIQFYKDNYKDFSIEEIAKNEYVVSDVMRCLRKLNKSPDVKKYLDSLGIIIDVNTPTRILNTYGWSLYDRLKNDTNIKIIDNEENDYLTMLEEESVDEIKKLFENDPLNEEIKKFLPLLEFDSKYSPFSKLFSLVLKKEKTKPNPNWGFISELLDQISVEDLSENCETFEAVVKGRNRTIELASDKEYWYAYKTKALLKLGDFQGCFSLSQQGLNAIERFHYNNNLWFARRIALCKKELGDVDHAIEELQAILKKRNEWFIQSELGDLFYIKENYSEALKYNAMAALNFGDIDFKVGLFMQMGRVEEKLEKSERAYEHYLLVQLLKNENGWKITQELSDLLERVQGDYNSEFIESKTLVNYLKPYWKSLLPEEVELANKSSKNLKGKISTLRKDKGFGFIRGDNKNEYYFKTYDLKMPEKLVETGLKVIFDLKPPRNENQKAQAYNIRSLK